ncbi:MAG: Gfo/Idh/MocA family oxidoreductase [Planctomycetes bacterium]|nr:Gfo/Idh/MocA family oxidoreductase [Planctomycetota bacterium]
MARRSSRREFLGYSALTAAGLWSGRRVWGSATRPANEKLGIAVVGVAGQGHWNLERLAETGEAIVALCDVDETRAADARTKFPDARFYPDFREMIDRRHKDIDAVLVATPDHTHAVATMAALKAGKHVYCEKPLTHSVWECRQVIETARKMKRTTQMGTQIHSHANYRRAVELVQTGAIGAVREVHVWCGSVWSGGERPRDTPPMPEGLHWDLWLGPAPERPYHPAYIRGNWRGWWDFGGGGHADMACHYMDLAHWALDLSRPLTVEAEGPPVHPESAPPRLTVRYEYPARGDKPPVKLTWCIGVARPDNFDPAKMPDWGAGVLFIGEKGMLIADYDRRQLLPEAQFAGFRPPAPFIPDSIGHHKEWVEACKHGGTTTCNFEYSGALVETVLLGNVAYRSGRKIEWDAARMKIPNAPEAEEWLRREYRKGWTLWGETVGRWGSEKVGKYERVNV